MQDCEAAGHGDAGLYPGAAADTGEQTVEPAQRYNQEVRFCDSHHNAAGYSGTTGNAVHVHHNRFYDNALGLTTDVFTASGHPGFPSDSMLIEDNEFYSNNFNPYQEGSDVEPTVPFPVGTGLWIAGGNNQTVRNNRFWDNWRRGVMLFSVPDVFVCPPDSDDQVPGCDPAASPPATSYRNQFHGNKMGVAPNGSVQPNGLDFWWDQGGLTADPGLNTGNCWYDNTGPDGTAASVTGVPSPHAAPPNNLPSDCGNSPSVGALNGQVGELLSCNTGDPSCTWFQTPPKP
jgi:Right handed beta helix region